MNTEKTLISFLITHYNRPSDLLTCIDAIKNLDITNSQVVVSDDASTIENLKIIKKYPIDTLILSKTNNGLAANINKGLAACDGQYIIYCQEDFVLHSSIKNILTECIKVLESGKADLIRFTANFKFKKLINLTENIALIPKFSIANFMQNYYQYSDHPFITKKSFYDSFGYYLENTSGRYGETEYAIRICNSKAKIAITKNYIASNIIGSTSVLLNEMNVKQNNYKLNKSIIKFLRVIRLYFEWLFYNKQKRGLITYKNGRNKTN